MQYLDVISKTTEWSLFVSKANHSISQLSKSMPNQLRWRSWSWMVLWRPTRPFRTNTPKKDVLFTIGDWNAKEESQETLGVTGKFGLGMQNEAGQTLIEFCQENALVIANTLFQQHKTLHMHITRWSTPKSDWLYSLHPKMEKLYTVKTRSSHHELLVAKFRLKLKKVGKPLHHSGMT